MWGRTAFGLLSHCESAGGESWHVILRSSRSSSATCAAKNPTGLVYVSSSSSLPHNRNLPMSSSAHHTGETQEGLAVLKNLVYSLYRTPPPPPIFSFFLIFSWCSKEWSHQLYINCAYGLVQETWRFSQLIYFSADLCSNRYYVCKHMCSVLDQVGKQYNLCDLQMIYNTCSCKPQHPMFTPKVCTAYLLLVSRLCLITEGAQIFVFQIHKVWYCWSLEVAIIRAE